jgi:DMSO/TMAO reductase YedYZ molybdopterin-dependent catalytic subunit
LASTEVASCARRFVAALALATCLGSAGAQTPSNVSDSIRIDGNVAQSLSMSVADLKRLPSRQFDYVSPEAEHKGDGKPRHYTGCLLRDVLAAAKPVESKPRELRKSYVVATASDGYEVVYSWAELFVSPNGDGAYVVYERDGAPLGDDEGRIAIVTVTDTKPVRHVKWLQRLTVRGA